MSAAGPYPAGVLESESSATTSSNESPTEQTAPEAPVEPTPDVLARLRAKVAERSAAGEYPEDLPARMAAHFEALLGGRGASSVDLGRVSATLEEARSARQFALENVTLDSNIPGGSAAHKLIGRATARQSRGLLDQVQASADATQRALDALAAALGQLRDDLASEARSLDEQTSRARLGVSRLDTAVKTLGLELAGLRVGQADLERSLEARKAADDTRRAEEAARADAALAETRAALEALSSRLAHLERSVPAGDSRLVRLEKAETARGFRPWYDTGAFEARFRGSRAQLLEQYHTTGRFFVDSDGKSLGPVLDIGCGRGEFLEVLNRWKVEAYGVEIDAGLVEDCRARGLRATLVEDGIAHLAGLQDETLGGVVMLQVIEHLSPQQQLDVVALAFRKLLPGGRFVAETVNAASLYVYANAMYLDPTHTRPVHPAYLGFLCEEIGFATVQFDYRSPVPDAARLPVGAPRLAAPVAETLTKLDALLHAPQDYLVVATK